MVFARSPAPDRARWRERAAHGAVREVFGDVPGVHMQRCQWHKRENVVSYLAKQNQLNWRRRLETAYAHPLYADAKRALDMLYAEAPVATSNSPTRGRVKLPHLSRWRDKGTLPVRWVLGNSRCRFAQAPALPVKLQQVPVVHQPIQQRRDDHRVAEQPRPVVDRAV